MGVVAGTNSVNSGLAFELDSRNIKFYNGPAITNLLTSISPMTTSGTGYNFVGGSEMADIPGLGTIPVYTCNIQNNYSAVSTWCCPNPFSYGGGIAVSPSTLYTYGIVYRCQSGYANANYMYKYEYNGGTYVGEGGLWSSSNQVYLGNGYYWAWGTFTTQATTNVLNGMASFYYRYSTTNDKLYVAKIFLAAGNYSNLHPKYWPAVGTARGTSSVFSDAVNKNPFTANSVTYGTDGSVTFNGSSNYVTSTLNSTYPMMCLDVWYYNNNAIPNNDTPIGGPSTYQTMIQFNSSYPMGINLGSWTGQITNEAIQIWSSTTSPYSITYNQNYVASGWHNSVFNWNGTTYDIWTDGVKTTTYTGGTGYQANLINLSSIQIGYSSPGYYFNGQIPVVKVYSRGLADSEVLSNFNANRGKYGI